MPAAPLVSVIIPCYNYARFLPQALESIRRQTHPATEIIVVDDGSTDDTPAVTAAYPEVRYLYQANQGVSAARNTGIAASTGQYLVFLDADDWLHPDALAANVRLLQEVPEAAFAAGTFTYLLTNGQQYPHPLHLSSEPYLDLLARGNFIAMIATILFARWALAGQSFPVGLGQCEDYQLYLALTRRYPVVLHAAPLAVYRLHAAAASVDVPLMLAGALRVLEEQRPLLRTPAEAAAHQQGILFWCTYYCDRLLGEVQAGKQPPSPTIKAFFLKYAPTVGPRHSRTYALFMLKSTLKRLLPPAAIRGLYRLGLVGPPRPGRIAAGDFKRLTPFNNNFGYERGGPIDRYYIENFLQAEAASISGRVLEIGDNAYTLQFGGSRVVQSDILHVDASNLLATFVGDLSDAPHLPDNAFDCIVLTQTLHLIYDFQGAMRTCFRVLKPGGVLLLTVPGNLTPIDAGEWKAYWFWTFTDSALRRLVADTFPGAAAEVQSFGNVYVAAAFLYGMGRPELTTRELDYYDPQFQVINTLKAVKPLARA